MTNTSGSSVRCSGRATVRTACGHHEADEPDDAAGGDARGGEERGADVDDPAGALDVRAEVMGRLVAEREQVEAPRAERR